MSDNSPELTVFTLLSAAGLTLGLAESVTGGLISACFSAIPKSSTVLRGAIVPYHRDLKSDLLGAPKSVSLKDDADLQQQHINVVSEKMVLVMAESVCKLLKSDVGLATTGVAGPDPHEGVDPGTVWIGVWLDGMGHAQRLYLPFERNRVRHATMLAACELLRLKLLAR